MQLQTAETFRRPAVADSAGSGDPRRTGERLYVNRPRGIVAGVPLPTRPLESTDLAISSAKISSLCNNSEILLVRASRAPELNRLSHSELKRLAARTRKLADKWLSQYRSQARIRSRQTGSGAAVSNTRLKAQVFSDAFRKLQARLAELDGPAPGGTKARLKTKKSRNASHRKTRAIVRKALARH